MDYKEYFEYLDDLRDSGVVNMYGATSFLMDEFALPKPEAKAVLKEWIDTYDERHPINRTGDERSEYHVR